MSDQEIIERVQRNVESPAISTDTGLAKKKPRYLNRMVPSKCLESKFKFL